MCEVIPQSFGFWLFVGHQEFIPSYKSLKKKHNVKGFYILETTSQPLLVFADSATVNFEKYAALKQDLISLGPTQVQLTQQDFLSFIEKSNELTLSLEDIELSGMEGVMNKRDPLFPNLFNAIQKNDVTRIKEALKRYYCNDCFIKSITFTYDNVPVQCKDNGFVKIKKSLHDNCDILRSSPLLALYGISPVATNKY